ncbi:MAG: TIGR02300 family protein [Parvularculales bacterium]
MKTPDLGHRHICPQCSTKFYDLNREPAACPKCGQKVKRPHVVASRSAVASKPPMTEDDALDRALDDIDTDDDAGSDDDEAG